MEILRRKVGTVREGHLLSFLFWATAGLQAYLLSTDSFLREAQPLHALAMATFIGVDVALAAIALGDVGLTLPFAFPWALLQLVALATNPLTGPQVGMDPASFATYLFSLWPYNAILVTRVVEALLCVGLLARRGPVLKQVFPASITNRLLPSRHHTRRSHSRGKA